MGSSPGFGSDPRHLWETHIALFRLAFASAPQRKLLNLATQINSPVHSSIGTPSGRRSDPLTACRHTVSGTISLPSRGSFHLSLTVLVHYRSSRVFSLGGWSPQLPTGFHVSRGTQGHGQSLVPFAYRTITFYGCPFQGPSARGKVGNSAPVLDQACHALQPPEGIRLQGPLFLQGLGCSPFVRHYSGNLG